MASIDKTVHISLTNDDLRNAVRQIIQDGDNKEQLVSLVHDLFAESHQGCNFLFKLLLGGKLPEVPMIGTVGYIKFESLSYGLLKENYLPLAVQGYIKVVVARIKPLHVYSPIVVHLPIVEGASYAEECHVDIGDFYPEGLLEL